VVNFGTNPGVSLASNAAAGVSGALNPYGEINPDPYASAAGGAVSPGSVSGVSGAYSPSVFSGTSSPGLSSTASPMVFFFQFPLEVNKSID
jgi:hypothetical protein